MLICYVDNWDQEASLKKEKYKAKAIIKQNDKLDLIQKLCQPNKKYK